MFKKICLHQFMFALALVTLVQTKVFGEVSYVNIKSVGYADTYESALNKALVEALQKVNGVSLKSKTLSDTISRSVMKGSDKEVYKDQLFRNQIYKETEGAIKSFEIIQEGKDSKTGRLKIEITATVAKFELSQSANRRRIAVLPFRINIGSTSIDPAQGERMLSQALVNYLTQTRKFAVIDRDFSRETDSELVNFYKSSRIEDKIKIGQKLNANYVIVGQIENLDIQEVEKKYLTSDRVFKSKKALIDFNYRIIDVPTSQIKFASQYRTQVNVKNESQPLSKVTQETAEIVGLEIMYAIYPILIEKIENGLVFLGQGGSQIKSGQNFEVYEMTKSEIEDSYTGEKLGNVETKVGKIQITESNSMFSVGKIIESKYDLASKFEPVKFVVKPLKNNNEKGDSNAKPKKPIDQKW